MRWSGLRARAGTLAVYPVLDIVNREFAQLPDGRTVSSEMVNVYAEG